jgi:hypothetical protein
VPARAIATNDQKPCGISAPKSDTDALKAPAASAPPTTMTSSLAAGNTASMSMSTKTA